MDIKINEAIENFINSVSADTRDWFVVGRVFVENGETVVFIMPHLGGSAIDEHPTFELRIVPREFEKYLADLKKTLNDYGYEKTWNNAVSLAVTFFESKAAGIVPIREISFRNGKMIVSYKNDNKSDSFNSGRPPGRSR